MIAINDITEKFKDVMKYINKIKTSNNDTIIFRNSSITAINECGSLQVINIYSGLFGYISYEELNIILKESNENMSRILYDTVENIIGTNTIFFSLNKLNLNPLFRANEEYRITAIMKKNQIIYSNNDIRNTVLEFENMLNLKAKDSVTPVWFNNSLIYLHPSMFKVNKNDKVGLNIYKDGSFNLFEFTVINPKYIITMYINTMSIENT